MNEIFLRTAQLVGDDAVQKLNNSRVAVFGIGGVGSYAAEILARSGVGHITLIDSDRVSKSNINRQLIALHSTVGMYKTEVCKARLLDINPDIEVTAVNEFFLADTADSFDFSSFDYVMDCVDTVAAKLEIIKRARLNGVGVISVMGTGNKLEPTAIEVTDVFSTKECPLAKVMRSELRKMGVDALKVVYSSEKQLTPRNPEMKPSGHPAPASVAFVPSVAGIIAASEVVLDLIGR